MSLGPHILVAFGTRPEAIKLAPLVLELQTRRGVHVTTCAVAQHRELLDGALRAFGVRADLDLDLMVPDQELTSLTARVLGRMREVIEATRPDLLVVQGDTTSAMASALAAHQLGVRVAHVEAGLRTPTIEDPWPEEANRRIITRLAALHFAPTARAQQNLLDEGVARDRVHVTGNTGIDAARLTTPEDPGFEGGAVLVTCHRRSNHRDDFARARHFMTEVSEALPDVRFVFPAHPGPRVASLVAHLKTLANFRVVAPLPYPRMLGAIARARAVVTDSGGVQEECAWFGTPCLVARGTCDRPESLDSGNARLVGFDAQLTVQALRSAVRTASREVFGDGHASRRIADLLCDRGQYTQR